MLTQIVIGIGAVVLLVILAAYAFISARPADFRVQRTAKVNAPPDEVFAIINDLHRWGSWSPYEKNDPNMKKTYGGAETGPGATYSWNGNNRVGEGRMTIVETRPGELVRMSLEFCRPFRCNNEVNFKLEPTQGGTQVSWIMDGKSTFMYKAMSLLVDMDKMCGKDFEQGLANLNNVLKGEPLVAR